MTCIENYMMEHPDENRDKVVKHFCPNLAGGIDIKEPENCKVGDFNVCAMCWNREIPEAAPVIKDSGNRTEFPSGAVRDIQEGKGRMDLLPWAAIMEVSKHCENGAAKYGEHNVDKGVPTSSLCNSAARHLAKFIDGWDDEPHLLAATWNLLWAVQMELKHPELCDVPWEGK